MTDPDNNTTTWSYDTLGRVTAEFNPLNFTRSFHYDAAGNLTRKIDRDSRTIDYVYDNLNRNIAEKWLNSSNSVIETIAFAYDAAGQLTQASDSAGTYTYSYDNLGRPTTQDQQLSGLTPQLEYTSQYNALSLLTQVQAKIGTTNDFQNTYQYDNVHA